MNLVNIPWVELAIGCTALGSIVIAQVRVPERAFRLGLCFSGTSFACTLIAWLLFAWAAPPDPSGEYSLQTWLMGRKLFQLDDLSAPLLPAVALLHFLTALATPRTKMRRFSFSWSLASESLRLAMFSTEAPWVLIALLCISTIPPYIELANRGRPTGVYLVHMTLFVFLLITGWIIVSTSPGATSTQAQLGTVLLMAAILVRSGTVPAHCWVTDWFEHASYGNAILYVVPLSAVYAAVRLVLPIAPDWILRSIGLMSLATAVYAAGMATIQIEGRRFYAYLFLSHASLVLVGLELQTPLSLTASLCLWFSVILSLGGFGLALRALEARFGRVSLSSYHGLYGHSPTLAICFLLTGLACVGFPATIGFISTELLVDSAVNVNSLVGFAVVAAAALNGIAVVRAYLLLFTGGRHVSTVSLEMGLRERFAILILAALILGGGLLPQPGLISRYHSVERVLQQRRELLGTAATQRSSESPEQLESMKKEREEETEHGGFFRAVLDEVPQSQRKSAIDSGALSTLQPAKSLDRDVDLDL